MRAVAIALISLALTACAARPHVRPMDQARLAIARELVGRRSWPEALVALQRFHAEVPPTSESLTLRGIALREQRIPDEAEADLKKAIRLDEDNSTAHAALAILQDMQGRFDEADEHHKRALELVPRNARYWNDWGFARFSRGKNVQAIEAYRTALQIEPTFRRARTNLGFAYARSGDFTRAAQQFELAETPAAARNNLGVAYESAGLLAPAYDAYLAAVRLEPGFVRARSNLVNVARAVGRELPPDVAPAGAGGR